MKEKEETIVVTARCIDMAASCDDIDKIPCIECGEMTWLSSSWRGRKIDKAICGPCFGKEKYRNGDYSANVTEECLNNAIKLAREHYGMKKTNKEIREKMMEIMEEKLGKKINVVK